MISEPNLHRLGILLTKYGMDVLITSRTNDRSLIYHRIDFTPGDDSLKALEEAVYDNPLLTSDFYSVDVVMDNKRFFMISEEDNKPDEIRRRIDALWPEERTGTELETKIIEIEPKKTYFVTAINRSLHSFLRRTFHNVTVTHRLAVLAQYHANQNKIGTIGKIHVNLSKESVDIMAFGREGLLLANTYKTNGIEDAVFYTLTVADSFCFDNLTDQIFVDGSPEVYENFMTSIRRFIPIVSHQTYAQTLYDNNIVAKAAPIELLLSLTM